MAGSRVQIDTAGGDYEEARLRVHFAPLGFEVDRLVSPAILLKADVVILLVGTITERKPARDAIQEVRSRLGEHDLDPESVRTELWDTPSVVDVVGGIVAAAPAHDYFFNTSTGPKPACLAGAMAANFWGVRAYYQRVNYDAPGVINGDYPADGAPQFWTRFKTDPPDLGALHTLQRLVMVGEPTTKLDLLGYLRERSIIRPSPTTKAIRQSEYGQLDTILQRLEGWGFVRIDGHGRSVRVSLTSAGKGGFKMFHHVLYYPKPLPRALQNSRARP